MILITYGTRPEYIKVKPLIDEMTKQNIDFKVLFTGQHKDLANNGADFTMDMIDYDGNRLDSVFKNCLSIDSNVFEGITHVLVQGDTTSAAGISVSAMHKKIKVIHLEAGLRTYDLNNPYPEEFNRKIISEIAELHLCPTQTNVDNLAKEGIINNVHLVGNTVLDNLFQYKVMCEYDDKVLVTMHRRENHDNITEWFTEINNLAKENSNLEFILPIHPNPNVIKHKDLLTNVSVCEPLNHSELLNILVKCKLVITDSGGIQEEGSFFNKKTLVCRKTTERVESIGSSSFLVNEPKDLKSLFYNHLDTYNIDIECPYGDGFSSNKICEIFKTL